ncbi:unnamed protein product [Camellia sinensis]
MLILSWNCQGVGRPLTFQILQGLCRTHRPQIIFLMETKNNQLKLEAIRRRLRYPNQSYVDPVGLSGGLALWWLDEVHLQVSFKSANLLNCHVSDNLHHSPWLATFVYAPPRWTDRRVFWQVLQAIAQDTHDPWLCIGDFNEVGQSWEKQGRVVCNRARIEHYQRFVSECQLMDLEYKGTPYTWTNNPKGICNVRERLDKALVTVNWRLLFPHAQVHHEPFLGSDHCPLLLHCQIPPRKVPHQFKFESMWTTHPECEEIIKANWLKFQPGSPISKVCFKLQACQRGLSEWSKLAFGNNRARLTALKTRLHQLQLLPYSDSNDSHIRLVQAEIEMVLLREEMFQHQRSRINWLSYGDRNSAFFHASVVQRRQRNQLVKLKLDNGVWLETDTAINAHLSSYFSHLFQAKGPRNFEDALAAVNLSVTHSMNDTLLRPVDDDEVKLATFQLGPLKAPGPDGFPGLFYQKHWHVVGSEVCKAVRTFFHTGRLREGVNHTNLILIPKVHAPEKLSQFRPISLCNFFLKIITKVLANRFKVCIKQLISPQQAAFVPGRLIQDSILIAHEAFHFLKHKKQGRRGSMALKLDFNKAYDRIQWDFLQATLLRLGFHHKWVRLVMECVTTVEFSVIVNGERRTSFTPSCGLRQGDPLSPYLFLLVADVLSTLIHHSLLSNAITGIRMRRTCPPLSHLFFADDAIIFFKAEHSEGLHILEILRIYSEAFGQILNFAKSGALFSANTSVSARQALCLLLGVSEANPKAKYLGLPASWGKSKTEAYSFLLEKALLKLQGWKSNLLSPAGRETLIKAVVQAIPSYAMACFELPQAFCSKLNSFIRNFWWKGDPDNRGICWAKWTHMTNPKSVGGMGLRDFKDFNLALLAKQGWRLLSNPDSYWARMYKGLYFPHSSFLQAAKGSNASWAWNSLLKGRELIQAGIRWQVQSGQQIRLWEDPWIPSLKGFKLLSAKPPTCDVLTVADVIDQVHKSWHLDPLLHCLSPAEVAAISVIPIAMEGRDDSVIWHHNKSGLYSVKSGYALARSLRDWSSDTSPSSSISLVYNMWKIIWRLETPPKIRHFWWKACHNLLATKAGLFRRKCGTSAVCPICLSASETVEHLLFDCSWSKAVWFGSSLNLRIDLGSIPNVSQWTSDIISQASSLSDAKASLSKIATVGWFIWKSRNEFVFNNLPVDPMATLHRIAHSWTESTDLFSTITPQEHRPTSMSSSPVSGWIPASFGSFKINCDASFC